MYRHNAGSVISTDFVQIAKFDLNRLIALFAFNKEEEQNLVFRCWMLADPETFCIFGSPHLASFLWNGIDSSHVHTGVLWQLYILILESPSSLEMTFHDLNEHGPGYDLRLY